MFLSEGVGTQIEKKSGVPLLRPPTENFVITARPQATAPWSRRSLPASSNAGQCCIDAGKATLTSRAQKPEQSAFEIANSEQLR
jgi:hypothetical protein